MKNLISSRLYSLMWLIVLLTSIFLAGGVYLLMIEKGQVVMTLQSAHNPGNDLLIRIVNLLGDGWTLILIGLLLLLVNIRAAFQVLLSGLTAGLIVFVFKKFIFPGAMRPMNYFHQHGGYDILPVEGIDLGSWHSFPSGHTAAAFALFISLALLNRNKLLDLLFVGLAILAALARLYLGQHFFEDVYFGALLGTLSAFGVHLALLNSKWYRQKWTRGSLLTHRRR